MTENAGNIMELFRAHEKVKTGYVLPHTELVKYAKKLGETGAEDLKKASAELAGEGYVIITPPGGLELTDKGYFYLFGEV
jgi:hypothetical protein